MFLPNQQLKQLRQQAPAWLRPAQAGHTRLREAASGQPLVRITQTEALAANLVCIRDKAALGKLPPDEQKVFTQLWADVAALLKRAEASAKEDYK